VRLPHGYAARLHRFDPDLRLRFSPRRGQWLLERRARYQRLPVDPRRYGFAEHDTVVQLRDGYFLLGTYQPNDLPTADRLIQYLRSQDTRRGGDQDLQRLAEAVADELDQQDAAREERIRQHHLADVAAAAGEEYEAHRWRTGVRVVVPAALPVASSPR
jgi:hypothetical protein